MAAAEVAVAMAMEPRARRDRSFKKYSYRGLELESLLDLSNTEFAKLLSAADRRRFERGTGRPEAAFVQSLRDAKRAAAPGEKPQPVKTHLRDMIVVPEMIGSVVAVHNGKNFNQIAIKAEMIGHKLGEFSINYKPVEHRPPGIGGTKGSPSSEGSLR